MPANEQINVLEINNAKNLNLVKDLLSKKNILYKITYKDVYGTKWLLSNEDYNNNSSTIPILLDN